MYDRYLKYPVRLSAALIVFMLSASVTSTNLRAGEFGGCLPMDDYACILKVDGEKYDKYCYSGNCITCEPYDEAVCEWCDHTADDTFNPISECETG